MGEASGGSSICFLIGFVLGILTYNFQVAHDQMQV